MNEPQKKFLVEMIGTNGLDKLIAISSLFPEENSYSDPFCLACNFLNAMIKKYCDIIRQETEK